jgi:hypothetical protein
VRHSDWCLFAGGPAHASYPDLKHHSEERRFFGELPGSSAIPDAPAAPHLLDVDLAFSDGELIGAATTTLLPTDSGDFQDAALGSAVPKVIRSARRERVPNAFAGGAHPLRQRKTLLDRPDARINGEMITGS